MKYLQRILLNDRIWLLTAVLLSIGFILLIFAQMIDSKGLTWTYLNADKLYSPIIFKDIFIDGSGLKGWHLNAAPNFFPDMGVYFILMALFRNILVCDFLFSLLQYLTFLFLIYKLYDQLFPERSVQYATLFIYLMFFFLLIPVFENRFLITFQLLSISYHFGATIMALASLNFLIAFLRTRKKLPLIFLIIFVILGTISDRLYLVQFVFPILPLAVLLFNRTHRKALLLPLSGITLLLFIGLFLFRMIRLSGIVYMVDTGFKMFNFENIGNSWHNFIDHMSGMFLNFHAERGFIILMVLAFLGTLIYLLKNIRQIFMSFDNQEKSIRFYLLIILCIFIPLVLFMPIINGAYVGRAIIRFNFMGLVMGAILLPLLLMTWEILETKITPLLKYLLPLTSITFLIIFSIKLAKVDFMDGMKAYFNYYPKRAMILDELKEEHDLKYGVSNYWHSKTTLAYSRNNTRLYAVGDTYFKPSYHTTNENWYHSNGKGKYKDPVFNYMTIDGFNHTEKLQELFGEQIDTIFDDGDIIVIKVPEFIFERGSRDIVKPEQP